MLNALSAIKQIAAQPEHTFLLVQEIVDEANYNRLTSNLQNLHTLCLGGSDKVRLVFSDETPAKLSAKVFDGLDPRSKATLLLLSEAGFGPASVLGPVGSS
jgi:hypothetical protein